MDAATAAIYGMSAQGNTDTSQPKPGSITTQAYQSLLPLGVGGFFVFVLPGASYGQYYLNGIYYDVSINRKKGSE
jgi:hypothetical protein